VAAEKASGAVQRLRTIAELEAGQLALRRDPVRLADIVTALLPTLRAEGRGRDVRIVTDLEPALPTVAGDRGRLSEAVGLVLRDALRRTAAGAALAVIASRTAHGIRLQVSHGEGAVTEGALALAHRLVAAHGGTLADGVTGTDVELPLA
jgi:signal transduction histidine kinase